MAGRIPKIRQAGIRPANANPAAMAMLPSVLKRLFSLVAIPGTNQPSKPSAAPMNP